MEIALAVSRRSTCPRKRIGAVVVSNNRIAGTGYNGAPRGLKHCDDVGCLIIDNHCKRIIHAEANALLQAGEKAYKGILYTTASPCIDCLKLALQLGIWKVVYAEEFTNDFSAAIREEALKEKKIIITKWEETK
jgi:dCMP deaminase